MHLADTFIQSDLVHSGYTFFCQYMCSLGIEPTTFARFKLYVGSNFIASFFLWYEKNIYFKNVGIHIKRKTNGFVVNVVRI